MNEHPIAHIPDATAYEWMREDCAALDAARQAREDNLMNVIVQTSSAAVLAIPGLFIASGSAIPLFETAWPVYVGTVAFALAFGSACIEQVLSGKAYQAQKRVVEQYYLKRSDQTSDKRAISRADFARNAALVFFAIAVSLASLGLAQFARGSNGKAPLATSNTVAPVAATVATTNVTSAQASPNEVQPRVHTATTATPEEVSEENGQERQNRIETR